jgi:hypothetical protein
MLVLIYHCRTSADDSRVRRLLAGVSACMACVAGAYSNTTGAGLGRSVSKTDGTRSGRACRAIPHCERKKHCVCVNSEGVIGV